MKTFTIEAAKFESRSRGKWEEYVIFLYDEATGKTRPICAINEGELVDLKNLLEEFIKSAGFLDIPQ